MNKKIRTIEELHDASLLPPGTHHDYDDLALRYDIGITEHVQKNIFDTSNASQDPVGRQYIPTLAELNITPAENTDPIGDADHSPTKGVVHRYADRALFKITNICAVYCRYCFRKDMIGTKTDHLSQSDTENAINYIRNNTNIWEVILTGGDPLVLSPRRLNHIITELNTIDHVQIIRIHTRVPIAEPDTINDMMLGVLQSCAKPLYVVVHINHAQELSDNVKATLSALHNIGCTLLSQSVLLKDINNNPETLADLFRTLITMHVKPYYLHHLDHAKGTSHFRVTIEEGQAIMHALRGNLSGICIPQYMLDIPGGYGKVEINNDTIKKRDDGNYSVRDRHGAEHIYTD